MQDFKKLQVWQKSHDLTVRIYELTSRFPREEMYGLTNQIRRACASIPTNIAENCGVVSSCQLPVNTPLLTDYSKCGGC